MEPNNKDLQLHNGKGVALAKFVFCMAFVALMIVPFLFLNTETDLQSEIENRAMTAWPGLSLTGEYNEWYGHYVEDRVAFREPAIMAYITGHYMLFHEFTEDLHMFGKDGYIFPADDGYIRAYQHEATDEQLIDDFVTYLDRTNTYLGEQGIPFYFIAGLDKKSVYDRYMPDSIHVNEDKESIMAMLDRKLTERDVPHVIPVEEMKERSRSEQLYNVMVDSAHWNDNGALYELQLLDGQMRLTMPDIPPLESKHFKAKTKTEQLEFIKLPLEEEVPFQKLRNKYAKHVKLDLSICNGVTLEDGTSMVGYINDREGCDKSVLVFHDSFLEGRERFFTYRFQKSYFVSRRNYTHVQEYVELLQPDVVIFENAERAFVDDLYMYTELADITYDNSSD